MVDIVGTWKMSRNCRSRYLCPNTNKKGYLVKDRVFIDEINDRDNDTVKDQEYDEAPVHDILWRRDLKKIRTRMSSHQPGSVSIFMTS